MHGPEALVLVDRARSSGPMTSPPPPLITSPESTGQARVRGAFRELDAERLEHTEDAKETTLPTWRLMLFDAREFRS